MKTRKVINSQLKRCKTLQKRCTQGSERWDRYRVKINKLRSELEQSTYGR